MRLLLILPLAITLAAPQLAAQNVPVQPGTSAAPDYSPATVGQRADWWAIQSFGWANWAAGAFTSGFWTWRISPEEWGPGWGGFGRRYGTRQAEVTMANGVEAALGTLWKEDPRYSRSNSKGFWRRTKWAISSAFLAHGPHGNRRPAVARGIGFVGARGVTGNWRPESQQDWWDYSLWPLASGFGGRVASNLFLEFSDDIFRRGRKQ